MDEIKSAIGSTVAIGAESILVLAANADRMWFRITNDSSDKIYLSLGDPAIYNDGIPLEPKGGIFEMPCGESLWKGAIYGISRGKTKNACVCEGSE